VKKKGEPNVKGVKVHHRTAAVDFSMKVSVVRRMMMNVVVVVVVTIVFLQMKNMKIIFIRPTRCDLSLFKT
jgi:hypothetical protein